MNKDGYFIIRVNGKRMSEHRHIMETFLGRKLSSKEHVHHKNGNRGDNRVENLEVLSLSDHIKKHHKEGVYKDYIERMINRKRLYGKWSRLYKRCLECGTREKKHQAFGLCTTCYGETRRLFINHWFFYRLFFFLLAL